MCGLDSINAAVAYLVLARGSLKDQRTTSWSVNSIEKHTGMARPRAVTAIQMLAEAGCITQTRGGSRPAYRIEADREAPDWIWLPNSIVDGVKTETPPIERIRQAQKVANLRLFVDLYHAQDLSADGGVNWRHLQFGYERKRIGQRGPYVVWGFWRTVLTAWEAAPFVQPFLTGTRKVFTLPDGSEQEADPGMREFWAALHILEDLGLVEFVAHLVEADSEEASVIHPLPMRAGEAEEQALGRAAHDAGLALLSDSQKAWVQSNGCVLAPVLRHLSEATVVGLLRHRYRAKTTATARWRQRAEEWTEVARRYQELEQEALSNQPYATSM